MFVHTWDRNANHVNNVDLQVRPKSMYGYCSETKKRTIFQIWGWFLEKIIVGVPVYMWCILVSFPCTFTQIQ